MKSYWRQIAENAGAGAAGKGSWRRRAATAVGASTAGEGSWPRRVANLFPRSVKGSWERRTAGDNAGVKGGWEARLAAIGLGEYTPPKTAFNVATNSQYISIIIDDL